MVKRLKDRLSKIRKLKVPYILRAGNQLGEFNPDQIIDYFEMEELPEVVYEGNKIYNKTENKTDIYAKIFAKMTNKNKKDFISWTGTDIPIALKNCESHKIYNPKIDLTHIFVLPKGFRI